MSAPEAGNGRYWQFGVEGAKEAARQVLHHDPDEPWTDLPVAADGAAAAAAVGHLARLLKELPVTVRRAMEGAADSAGQLSDDRLQGLAELIQNADDVGATDAFFAVDPDAGGRLLFEHNGSGLRLPDVLGLAIPWLSVKARNAETLGRFGIGLKTLQSLSETLEVHEGLYHVRFDARSLESMDGPISWPGWTQAAGTTRFAIPLQADTIDQTDVERWLTGWGEAGMIFLSHLRSIALVDRDGQTVVHLRLQQSAPESLSLGRGGATVRHRATSADGRAWLVYTQRPPTPTLKRARKARENTTPVAVAFATFPGDPGHLHVGLPVRAIGLPFRLAAQFTPLTNRRDLADDEWNAALIPLVSELWLDACLHLFEEDPRLAWSTVPLTSEFSEEERRNGRLAEGFSKHLMSAARRALAEALTFDTGEGRRHLAGLAYEVPELTDILQPADVQRIAGRVGTVSDSCRSTDERWRVVLADLAALGAATPKLVTVSDALPLLGDVTRTPAFVADLTAVGLAAGLGDVLRKSPCVVLADDTHLAPDRLRGLRILLAAAADPLWKTLKMGSVPHPDYAARGAWASLEEWLVAERACLRRPSARAALQTLSGSGNAGEELPQPLDDAALDALRTALEAAPETERPDLGEGIGRAIRLDATTYGPGGDRIDTHARPCDAYLIEREASTWSVAAARTPGIIWLHRRYSTAIRAESRAGIGAQRLFRLLGAETSPRLITHPGGQQRYKAGPPGVPLWIRDSPERRGVQMRHVHATYTVGDHAAPDLDAVLEDIAKVKDQPTRRRRANAVLNTLSRAWDRLGDRALTLACAEDYGWADRGRIDAWWMSTAASTPWLSTARGSARPPGELRIKTPATVAVYGDDPARYLHPGHNNAAFRVVLEALGVAGDPAVSELIENLALIRGAGNDPAEAADASAPLYQAIAAQARPPGTSSRRLGDMSVNAARAAFSAGPGLITTNVGWRRPSTVFSGPAIFGDLRPFVPAVSDTDGLWRVLGVKVPRAEDALAVLRELARKKQLNSIHRQIMLESLRLLAEAPAGSLGQLRRLPVWTNKGWSSQRPVFAVRDPQVAEALAGEATLWAPGGSLEQLDKLIAPLGLSLLDTVHGEVVAAQRGTYDPELTQIFGRAVQNLQADLALGDPAAEQTLTLSWDDLAGYRVVVLPELAVRLRDEQLGSRLPVSLNSWLDRLGQTLYVADEDAPARAGSGGYAVASLFTSDPRRVAHDWAAAWSEAEQGHRAEAVVLAARLDADLKRKRDAANDERLRGLADQATKRRQTASSTRPGSRHESDAYPPVKPRPARVLVDPDALTLWNPAGEVVPAEGRHRTVSPGARKKGELTEPDTSSTKKGSGGRGPANFTPEEREDVGMRLVRRVLGGDDQAIFDIRRQYNVGADAVDSLDRFYELKVHGGPIPDVIRLQDSEVQRALSTDDFFLVLVGNVEAGSGVPEVRIVTDPLGELTVEAAGSVSLGGVRTAKSLRYTFTSPDAGERPTSRPGTDEDV